MSNAERGTGSVFPLKKGKWKWGGEYHVGPGPDGKRRPPLRSYGNTRAEAQANLDPLIAAFLAGVRPAIDAKKLTVKRFIEEEYLPKVTADQNTYRSYEQLLRIHVIPAIGGLKLTELNNDTVLPVFERMAQPQPETYEDGSPIRYQHGPRCLKLHAPACRKAQGLATNCWLRACKDVHDPKCGQPRIKAPASLTTRKMVWRTLSVALNYAVKDMRILPSNPLTRMRITTADARLPREGRALNDDERAKLLSGPPDLLTLFIKAAMVTGGREGELLGLVWTDIKPGTRWVRISSQYLGRFGKYGPTKGRRNRDIPILDELAADLLAYRAVAQWSKDTDPVFATKNGRPYLAANLLKVFKRRAAEVGIEGHVTIHDLRRTHGTFQARRVPIQDLSAVLGHSSPKVTYDSYIAKQLNPDNADAYLEELREILTGKEETTASAQRPLIVKRIRLVKPARRAS